MATRTRKKQASNVDTYQFVTDRITAALEQGIVPWHQPWKNFGAGANAPASLSSGKPYQGINVFMLGVTAMTEGYTSRWWGTYRQITAMGGQVRRGEKGTPIVFWRVLVKKDATGEVTGKIPFLRSFTVFNADQCDGLDIKEDELPTLNDVQPVDACEEISDGYRERGGPSLQHGGDEAYYMPTLDIVSIPLRGQFESAEAYYSTLFHEYVHSTGHKTRLDREGTASVKFGSPVYSKEEMIAEMGAAFLCGAAGIPVRIEQSASYLSGWMSAIKDAPKMLVLAAAAAQKAADLIVGIDRNDETTAE